MSDITSGQPDLHATGFSPADAKFLTLNGIASMEAFGAVTVTLGAAPTLKDAAIAYARNGHAVFPLVAGTKIPHRKTRGLLDATTDVDKIRRHWEQHPDSNIGLRPAQSQYAIDVDTAESHRSGLDGYATLAELVEALGPLPDDAPTTETASGGLHIWLTYDGGELAGILGPGIQIKGHGGYLVAPPSIIGGKPYRWRVPLNGSPPLADDWTDQARPPKPAPKQPKRPAGSTFDGDSVIDGYNANASWSDILTDWTCDDTNPDDDGAVWLHPTHTSKCSATITGGRLYVYSPNTPFDQTTAGNPHGYDRFDAYALLNHNGNASAAAKAIYAEQRRVASDDAGESGRPEKHGQPSEFAARNMFQQARYAASQNVDGEVIDGATLLDDIAAFLSRFIAYPSDHAKVAHTLWIAHTWLMDCWDSTPRIAFLSPEPGSGKTRALEVSEPLVPNPIHSVNVTSAYLFRKIADAAPTLLYDEIDTVFGPKARDNEDIRGVINSGHRNGATAGRCVVKGKAIETEDLPSYCAVAVAGLNDLPDTIMDRCVVIRMRRRAPSEPVEPWRPRVNVPEATPLRDRLVGWSVSVENTAANHWPEMPEDITDRHADCWEALLAVADLAGGHWPGTARVAAVAVVADSRKNEPSLGVMLLRDIKTIFTNTDSVALATAELLTDLKGIADAPWRYLGKDGNGLDTRGLARMVSRYEIRPKNIRIMGQVLKGYERQDFADAWERYPAPSDDDDAALSSQKSATSATNRYTAGQEP